MFTWSSDNRACKTTWSTLFELDQLKAIFKDAGSMKMSELTYWNNTDSDNMRLTKVNEIAIEMDNIFIKERGAKYEKNKSKDTALEDIKNIMTNSDKTVQDLAEVNDNNYLFWNEVK
jgi:hypothetical protein